jgi:hypothetical protein
MLKKYSRKLTRTAQMALRFVKQGNTFDLTSRDILYLLSCIESMDRATLTRPENKALYLRLVQEYLGIVSETEPYEARTITSLRH